MPLAAPDYGIGWQNPVEGGGRLFAYAGWILRRCKELRDEPTVDVFKLYDLEANCLAYRTEAAKWIKAGAVTEVVAELIRLTQAAGKGGPVKTAAAIDLDYRQLHANAGTFATWAAANLPAVDAFIPNVTMRVARRGLDGMDFDLRVPKTAAITNAVAALLATFD